MLLLAPASAVDVVLQLAGRKFTNKWILPVRQLHAKTGSFTAEQLVRSMSWLWKAKPIAPHTHGVGIADFGSDCYDVAQSIAPFD